MNIYEVIKRPIQTEKTVSMAEFDNDYVFEVALEANKPQIKEAVERLFDVEVVKVRTMIVKGRQRRWGRHTYTSKKWKKAIVTLEDGDTIPYFEGV